MARSSNTARPAAPVPMTSATTVSSHTRRSTVKSRNADGLDLIEPSSNHGGRMHPDMLQSPFKARPQLIQFAGMLVGEAVQNLPAFLRYMQERASPVFRVSLAGQQSFSYGTVHQFHSAVVSQSQPLGRIGNRDGGFLGRSSHLQK